MRSNSLYRPRDNQLAFSPSMTFAQRQLATNAPPPPPSAAPISPPQTPPHLTKALAYASALGILTSPAPGTYNLAPFSLLPCPTSLSSFNSIVSNATLFNKISHRMIDDYEGFLRPAILPAALADKEFTGQLLAIADHVKSLPTTLSPGLNIFRSDYMFTPTGPLQVELNTIASSFGCLSTRITALHKYLHPEKSHQGSLPKNNAESIVTRALAAGHSRFVATATSPLKPMVVMVVQPNESNSIDQNALEMKLLEEYGIGVLRRSLRQLDGATYSHNDLTLTDDCGDTVVGSVVYFRAGYTPDDYPTRAEWDARRSVECSSAIKCPNVFTHLFGAKKIQQVITGEVLGKYCRGDEESIARKLMTGLWGFGEGSDDAVISMALANPHNYVLKPQREGGGNNLYDSEMVAKLKTMGEEERQGYVLMQLIKPAPFYNELVRGGEIVFKGECVSEIGIFGASLGDEIIGGEEGGFILRCKTKDTNEGGVAAGYAFLSSPELV